MADVRQARKDISRLCVTQQNPSYVFFKILLRCELGLPRSQAEIDNMAT
jgi:hypothetical protein